MSENTEFSQCTLAGLVRAIACRSSPHETRSMIGFGITVTAAMLSYLFVPMSPE